MSIHTYNSNPKTCKHCSNTIEYRYRTNVFCSQSCAATFNNKLPRNNKSTKVHSIKCKYCSNLVECPVRCISIKCDECKSFVPYKTKTIQLSLPESAILAKEPLGEYSKVYFIQCKRTGIVFSSQSYQQRYHPNLITDKKSYREACRFTFNLNILPGYSDLIKEHGFYKASNKGNNLDGLSRDHMFSVNDGWLLGISPEIMRHPANCQLMPHTQNQKKSKKSSITYDELLERIKEFGGQGEI